MAVSHPEAIRNSIADLVVDKLDLGSANPSGRLIFNTTGDIEVATLALSTPAFGDSAAGTSTAGSIAEDSNATGGVTTKCVLTDRDNTPIINGSVGIAGSGADIILSSTTIGATDVLRITSLTYSAPA